MFGSKTEDWPLNTEVDHSHPHSHADSAGDTGWDLEMIKLNINWPGRNIRPVIV